MLKIIEKLIDYFFFILPQKRPTPQFAERAKLVAHRGAHKYGMRENTLKSIEYCVEHGIWGIEFDIRWTKDHNPILLHNADAAHIFNRPDVIIKEITTQDLKKEIPEIPTLEEVIQKFGGKIHFMIELKECFSSHSKQIKRFKEILAPLNPVVDYHFLSLKPEELLSLVDFPKEVLVAVSFLNTKNTAEFVLNNKFGGHCGHFLLLTKQMQKLHKDCQQKIGTGYISSENSLYREINRGVDWIFTNRPLEMKEALKKLQLSKDKSRE